MKGSQTHRRRSPPPPPPQPPLSPSKSPRISMQLKSPDASKSPTKRVAKSAKNAMHDSIGAMDFDAGFDYWQDDDAKEEKRQSNAQKLATTWEDSFSWNDDEDHPVAANSSKKLKAKPRQNDSDPQPPNKASESKPLVTKEVAQTPKNSHAASKDALNAGEDNSDAGSDQVVGNRSDDDISLPPPSSSQTGESCEKALGASLRDFLEDDGARWHHSGADAFDGDRSLSHLSLKSEPAPNLAKTTIANGSSTPTAELERLVAFLKEERWNDNQEGEEVAESKRSLISEPPPSPMRRNSLVTGDLPSAPLATPPTPAMTKESKKPPLVPGKKSPGKSLGAFFLEESGRWDNSGDGPDGEERSVGHRSLKSEPPMSPFRKSSIVNGRSPKQRQSPNSPHQASPLVREGGDVAKLLGSSKREIANLLGITPPGLASDKKEKPPMASKKEKSLTAFFDDSRWTSSNKTSEEERSVGHISLQSEPPYTPTRTASPPPMPRGTVGGISALMGNASKSKPSKKVEDKRGKSLSTFFDDPRWQPNPNQPEEVKSVGQLSHKSEPPMRVMRKSSIVTGEKLGASSKSVHPAESSPKTPAGRTSATDRASRSSSPSPTTWDDDVKSLLHKLDKQLLAVASKSVQI